jgi:DNA-binding transcriptional regulator GbsR (MarR family)
MSPERFVEEIGLVFDSLHLPRMAGRVLGAILLGPADGLTAGELADTLQASKGSISNMTQLLIHYRFIARTVRAGDRRDRFVPPTAWNYSARRETPSRCKRSETCTPFWNVSCPGCSIAGKRNG